MVQFDAAHRAVHYPPDRRFRIWIRPSVLIGIAIAIFSVIAAAWIEVAIAGMPRVPGFLRYTRTILRGHMDFRYGCAIATFQFSVCDDADSQRTVHFGGPSSPLFQ